LKWSILPSVIKFTLSICTHFHIFEGSGVGCIPVIFHISAVEVYVLYKVGPDLPSVLIVFPVSGEKALFPVILVISLYVAIPAV
jgi:hypothetical protein